MSTNALKDFMSEGYSISDIEKMLDTIKSEEKQKNAAKLTREKAIQHYRDIIVANKDPYQYTAAVAVLELEKKHPSWDTKKLQELYNAVHKSVKMIEDMNDKSMEEVLRDSLNSVFGDDTFKKMAKWLDKMGF